jgi:hypothetical protein
MTYIAPNQRNFNGLGTAPQVWRTDVADYCVVVAHDWKGLICQRFHGGDWTVLDMADITGQPLGTLLDSTDDHYRLAVAVEAQGLIHVVGNIRGTGPIQKIVSTNPHDLTSWTTDVPDVSDLILYDPPPQAMYQHFVRCANGDLLWVWSLRRHSATPGASVWPIYRKPAAGGAWQRVHAKVMSVDDTWGNSDPDWPFVRGLHVDPATGYVWMSGLWRWEIADIATSKDGWVIVSKDHGTTWESVTGAPVTLPFTEPTSKSTPGMTYTTDSIPTGYSIAVLDGVPHITSRKLGTARPEPGTHRWWWNGTSWSETTCDFSVLVTHNDTIWGVGVEPGKFPRRCRMVDQLGTQPSRGLGGYQPFMVQPSFAPGDDLVVNMPTANGPAVWQTGHRAPLIVAAA